MKSKHRGRNKHHLVPKSRIKAGVKPLPRNLLLIDIERHVAWHKLFREMTLDEAISLLKRLRKIKRRHR